MTRKRSVAVLAIGSGAFVVAAGGTVLAASPHHHSAAAPSGSKFISLAKDSPSDASPSKQVTVRCPKGRFAVGGGAHLHFTGEPNGIVPLAITQTRPDPDSSARPTGWVAAANATGPYASSWGVEVHIICSH
jgi:hypothetical protein